MANWNGKLKAVTFSYDDGVTQDKRLIKLFDKYGLRATFNVNSSLLGLNGKLHIHEREISHVKNRACEVKEIYAGHEVAVHTLTHPNLTENDDETVVWQVEEDRLALQKLAGYEIRGMAYPCGGVNNDDRVAKVIKERTGVRFARTITSSYSFDLQDNLYRFNPTVYHADTDKLFELGEKFINFSPDKPQLFYIWGHSYELDSDLIPWDKFEKFCKMISGKNDIFYGTNSECLLND